MLGYFDVSINHQTLTMSMTWITTVQLQDLQCVYQSITVCHYVIFLACINNIYTRVGQCFILIVSSEGVFRVHRIDDSTPVTSVSQSRHTLRFQPVMCFDKAWHGLASFHARYCMWSVGSVQHGRKETRKMKLLLWPVYVR